MAYLTTERKNTLIGDIESVAKLLPNGVAKKKLEEIINQIRSIDSIENHEWYTDLFEELFKQIAELNRTNHDLTIGNLEMRQTNEELSKRVTCLEEKLKSIEIERNHDYHWIIVRSGLNSFVRTFFKTVHPEAQLRKNYSYHFKDIVNEFDEYKDPVKKDKARKKWEELKQKFSINESFENKFKRLIRQGNNTAHPSYDAKSFEESVNILLQNEDIIESDKTFVYKWQE